MTTTDDLERGLRSWMTDEARTQAPGPLYDAIIGGSRAVRQRHRGRFGSLRAMRWAQGHPDGAFAPRRIATTLLLISLAILTVGTAVLVGSRLLAMIPKQAAPTGLFEPTGQIPGAVDLQRPAITVLQDGRVMIAGGNNDFTQTAVLYDPVTGTFGESIRMRASRWGASATTLRDGRVLVAGGMDPTNSLDQSSAELFDPATGTFTSTGALGEARADHTATLLADGRVLIVGGSVNIETPPGSQSFTARPIASAELYDPATGTFTTAGSMTTDRTGHTATLLPDGTVLVAGGYAVAADGTSITTASVEVFDPVTGTFSPGGALTTAREGHSATVLPDGRVLMTGGGTAFTNDGFAIHVSSSAELFDPRTGTSAPTGSLHTERTGHSATLLPDGRVLVAGGGNDFGEPLTAELFDPKTATFEVAGKATSPHRFGAAPLLADGRVFLPAPWGSELYDPKGQSPSSPPTSATPSTPRGVPGAFRSVEGTAQRTGHTATLLADGRILVAGGSGPDGAALATAEIFDPGSGTFSPTGSMVVAREYGVATRLPDGRVLIAGGGPSDAVSAEVYDPAMGSFSPAPPKIVASLQGGSLSSVSGLTAGTLLLERYVAGTDTTASSLILTLIDASDGHAIASTELCASGPDFGSPAAMLRDGRLLILGCQDLQAQLFDPATGATVPAGIQGEWVAATRLVDGRVILTSALQNGDSRPSGLDVTAVYDPATGALHAIPPGASTPFRSYRLIEQQGSTVELQDGRVLLVGGFRVPLDSASLFDPATGVSRDIGPLLASRQQPSVTMLNDGRVLIVGGVTQSPDRTDPVPPAAELFDPGLVR